MSTPTYRNAAGFSFDEFVEVVLIIKINHVPISVFVFEDDMEAKIVLETVFQAACACYWVALRKTLYVGKKLTRSVPDGDQRT